MGCLVSIFTVGINSYLFCWPVESVHGPYPNVLRHSSNGESRRGLMTSSGHRRYLIQ